ncbi:MAG: outer membrane beta-barrel protein [Acidobacteriota bacterium]
MSSRPVVFRAAVALLGAGVVHLAGAAGEPEYPSSDAGYIEVGAIHVRPGLELKNVGYDSNVFLSPDQEEGDYTATLSPSVEAVTLFGHRGRLDLSQTIDLVAFLETSSQNHVDSETSSSWDIFFGDFTYSGGLDLLTRKLRPNDELTERIREEDGEFSGQIAWEPSVRTELFFRAEGRTVDFSGDARPFGKSVTDLNRDEVHLSLGGRLPLRPKTDALFQVEREVIRHDREELGRDATAWRVVQGLRFDPQAIIGGELRFGVLHFDPDSQARTGFDGMIGRASLSTRLGRRLVLRGWFNKDLVFSIFGDNLFYLSRSTGLEATTSFTRRFSLLLGGSISENNYAEPVNFSAFQGIRQDRIRSAWVGWSFAPAGAPRFGLQIRRRQRESNFDLANDRQVLVTGNATYTF